MLESLPWASWGITTGRWKGFVALGRQRSPTSGNNKILLDWLDEDQREARIERAGPPLR